MKKSVLKKVLSVCFAILISISGFSVNALTKTENQHRDSLTNGIYVTNNQDSKKESKRELIKPVNTEDISSSDVVDSDIVIVNFEELYNDAEFANNVTEQLYFGKIFYIRAEGYSANRTIISQVLGLDDRAGFIRESTEDAVKNREGTFGYVVFVDSKGNLQIVRQLIATIDEIEKIERETVAIREDNIETNSAVKDTAATIEIDNISLSDINFSFSDELDAIDSFLEVFSQTDMIKHYEDENKALSAKSAFSSYTYEVLYDTVYYYGTVKISSSKEEYKKIGALTRVLYAKRMYCATSDWSNTSQITSKWGYMVDVWMQPTWNQSITYRSMNYRLETSFSTFPQGKDNATYQMIFRDYTPTVDVSGKTDVTLSVGLDAAYDDGLKLSGSSGFSVTTSYKDVVVTVPYWQVGKGYSQNIAGWNFLIGEKLSRITTNPVATSTVKLPAGVVLWNYGTKYSCVQLNVNAVWYINQGALRTKDFMATGKSAVVWRPTNLY